MRRICSSIAGRPQNDVKSTDYGFRCAAIRELIEGNGCPGLSHLAVALETFEFARIDGSLLSGHSSLAMATINLLG